MCLLDVLRNQPPIIKHSYKKLLHFSLKLTIPKYNRKNVESSKSNTHNTHERTCLPSYRIYTKIKSGGAKKSLNKEVNAMK